MIKLKDLIKTIESTRLMLESPMKSHELKIDDLDSHDKNIAYTLGLKNNTNAKLVDKFDKYEIYQLTSKYSKYDFFINGDFVYAYFKYNIENNIMVEQQVWQDIITKGLCRKILFEHYLPKFQGILSDALHSPMGERYWHKLLKDAMEKGYKLYIVYREKQKMPLADLKDIDKYFMTSPEGMKYRFLIEK